MFEAFFIVFPDTMSHTTTSKFMASSTSNRFAMSFTRVSGVAQMALTTLPKADF